MTGRVEDERVEVVRRALAFEDGTVEPWSEDHYRPEAERVVHALSEAGFLPDQPQPQAREAGDGDVERAREFMRGFAERGEPHSGLIEATGAEFLTHADGGSTELWRVGRTLVVVDQDGLRLFVREPSVPQVEGDALEAAAAALAVHSNAYRDPEGPHFEGSEEDWLLEHAERAIAAYLSAADLVPGERVRELVEVAEPFAMDGGVDLGRLREILEREFGDTHVGD